MKHARAATPVVVTLGDGDDYSEDSTQFASAATSSSAAAAQSYSSVGGARSISAVDFRRTRDGGGRVVVNLSDPTTPVDIRQEGNRVVAVFKDTVTASRAHAPSGRYGLRNAGERRSIRCVPISIRASLLPAEGKFEQLAYQSDNEFTIEINPVAEDAEEGSSLFSETREYEGQRLTLNFQDIETRAVLQLLAETSGRNIVVSDTVQGNVTLRLRNVPWDQALDIVMTTKGLDMRQNGNVIIVAPAEEIAARETADLEAQAGDPGAGAALLRVPAG